VAGCNRRLRSRLLLWWQNIRDGLYGLPGNLLRSGMGTTARYVGSQPALMVSADAGRHVTIALSTTTSSPDRSFASPGPDEDVTYFGAWVSFAF